MHSDLHLHLMNADPGPRFAPRPETERAAARSSADAARREPPELVIRFATPADAPALRRLAELDSTAPLGEEVLLALTGGEPVAALALAGGRTAADPFRRTEDAVALLRLRARHLVAAEARRALPRRRGLRLLWG